ncbi:hypothetical protein [Planktotalea arctica]|uniref:DUF7832 domain-containing protein n=1 Tax=Planktotalea arctica TaxID=1481893 RepID=UPI000A16CDEF|nr:hypothetical protein [Planktotalea arctica]
MKYDDASWHYGGDFPAELEQVAGATHIGMFVAWALLSGLGGKMHTQVFPDSIPKLSQRRSSPAQIFIEACDEKFVDEDLNDEGNAFASRYYEKGFSDDYFNILVLDLPSVYHVEDTWDNFDLLKPILDARLAEWRKQK